MSSVTFESNRLADVPTSSDAGTPLDDPTARPELPSTGRARPQLDLRPEDTAPTLPSDAEADASGAADPRDLVLRPGRLPTSVRPALGENDPLPQEDVVPGSSEGGPRPGNDVPDAEVDIPSVDEEDTGGGSTVTTPANRNPIADINDGSIATTPPEGDIGDVDGPPPAGLRPIDPDEVPELPAVLPQRLPPSAITPVLNQVNVDPNTGLLREKDVPETGEIAAVPPPATPESGTTAELPGTGEEVASINAPGVSRPPPSAIRPVLNQVNVDPNTGLIRSKGTPPTNTEAPTTEAPSVSRPPPSKITPVLNQVNVDSSTGLIRQKNMPETGEGVPSTGEDVPPAGNEVPSTAGDRPTTEAPTRAKLPPSAITPVLEMVGIDSMTGLRPASEMSVAEIMQTSIAQPTGEGLDVEFDGLPGGRPPGVDEDDGPAAQFTDPTKDGDA